MRAAALLLVWAGCNPALAPGRYACADGSCPPGWFCQIREAHEARCYPDREGPHCGDGVVDAFERCDGDVPCTALGFYEVGTARCSADCTTFDLSGCLYCGDGKLNGPEECDGLDQGGRSCSDFSQFIGGALGCSSTCRRTFDACIGPWKEEVAVAVPSAFWGLVGVWFSSPDEGFAVGPEATILRYASARWTPEVAPALDFAYGLEGVVGTGSGDVYAIGFEEIPDWRRARGVILRREGGVWRDLFPASAPLLTGPLRDVWTADGHLYLAGVLGLFDYDLAHPSVSPRALYLTEAPVGLWGVWARGVDDVYAAGGNWDTQASGLIVHWDGSEARVVYADAGPSITEIWGAADAGSPIYAVSPAGLLESADGRDWTPVPLRPEPSLSITNYAEIWGTSATDIFVAFNSPYARIHHFDGASWAATTPGDLPRNYIWGLGGSAGRVFAVGGNGGGTDSIWRHSEHPWVAMSSPTSSDLHAITGTVGGDLFAVGAKGTLLRSDGKEWEPWTAATASDLYAAWSPGSDTVFAAGDQTLLRCTSGSCTPETLTRPASQLGTFKAIWGSSIDNVFAATVEAPTSAGDAIWLRSADGWTEVNYPFTNATALRGLWGSGPDDVLAVGAYLVSSTMAVLHKRPNEFWDALDPGRPGGLTAVWGTSRSHVFAVADDGTILHLDGATWSLMSQAAQPLNGIWGRSATDVYAVGAEGSIQHYDGASWTPMLSGTGATLNGVWADDQRGVYAVGAGGVIVHLAGQLPAIPGGECSRPVPLHCGASASFGDTTGAVSRFESYGCGERGLFGGEVYYRFDSPINGHIVAHLKAHDGDLDLIVVGADGNGGCAPMDGCLAASQSIGATEARVQLSVARDQTYYVIVDGAAGAASGYTIALDCTPEDR